MFSWQMPDSKICIVVKRKNEPQFVVSHCGYDEGKILGEIEVKVAWIESFMEENEIESKFIDFVEKKIESIKYIKNKRC